MVENGRQIGAGLRHLDVHGADPASRGLADALAGFLVGRCEARHAGWRVLRQLVVESSADVPWEKTARRAVPLVADELIRLSQEGGRTPLHRAQHVAARARATTIARHVEPDALLAALKIEAPLPDEDAWAEALRETVRARSRERARKLLAEALGGRVADAADD